MKGSPDVPPLLSPATLARLERLEVVSRKVFRGKVKGERISRRKGQSVEFADFRNYVPGDDLRLIDWNLYARLDQLFLKLFQEEEDLHVHVLVDASASMGFGTPTKLHLACQTAAAIGYVGLCRGDRVTARSMGPAGHRAPVVRSRSAAARMMEYLGAMEPDQNVSLIDGVKDFLVRGASPGVVVLITDPDGQIRLRVGAAAIGRTADGHRRRTNPLGRRARSAVAGRPATDRCRGRRRSGDHHR